MRSWLWSHVDEDAVTVDPHGIALQASTFGIHAVTGACVEGPLVRSTGDDVAAELSGGKRVRQMGAPVMALDVSNCDGSCVEDGQRARGGSDHGAGGVRYDTFGEGDPGTSLEHGAGRSE